MKTALLLIDVQQGFDDHDYWGGKRNNLQVEQRIAELLSRARQTDMLIIHVRHASLNSASPLHQSRSGYAFKPEAKPLADEVVLVKNVNSCFIGTDLEQRLRDAQIDRLVIAGLTTDHCVSTTTRMAGNLGFDTYLVHDACATFPKRGLDGEYYDAALIHNTALASLDREFASVINTAEALALL